MGSIAQYLHPGFWGDTLGTNISGPQHAAFWIAVLQVSLINILLSGDNAVVIAMACRGLPPHQRPWGIVMGASLSATLLIIFTVVVAQLMALPYVKLIGGLVLFYIATKLLVPEEPDKDEVEAVAHLWRAVRIVATADIIMSFDNIVAVATAARNSVALLMIGLAISIPVILAGAALVMALLDRFPILIWAGAALLGWIGGEVIATDPAVSGYLSVELSESVARQIEIAAACAGAVTAITAGGFWRRSRKSKRHAEAAGNKVSGA